MALVKSRYKQVTRSALEIVVFLSSNSFYSMTEMNADAIITLVSAIPALLIASLTAWFAYLALRCQNVSRNDLESRIVEYIASRIGITPSSQAPRSKSWPPIREPHSLEAPASSFRTSNTLLPSCENLPQLQFPPVALLRSGNQDEPDFCRLPSCQTI